MDEPNTRPGYCPECSQRANIWDYRRGHWECSYCNWHGARPNAEPHNKVTYGNGMDSGA